MQNNNEILLSAKNLKWARKTLYGGNLSEPASKLKISEEQLKIWEEEGASVSVMQLKKIAKVYKRHVSVMLLEVPPVSQEPPEFRKLINFEEAFLDKKTFLAIRQAQEIQNRSIYIRENYKNVFIKQVKGDSGNPEDIAKVAAGLLDIDTKTRFKSKTSREQLAVWKRKLESVGIIVLELSFPIGDARGFAIFDKIAPLIVLNSKDTDNGRVFSLFHELGHLVLGQSDIDKELSLERKRLHNDETFCNRFAASFLVPTELIKEATRNIDVFDDDWVKTIANKFKVSVGVIWRRLRDNNLIDSYQLNRVVDRLSIFEPFMMTKSENNFRANKNTHLHIMIKRKSELYISEVFDAFSRNRITYYEMIDYIGIKPESLPRLQRLMFV